MNTYKIVLIGDACTGKTTYINRLLTGEYTTKYIPTLGVEVHPLVFHTNYGQIIFNIWDCAGYERFSGLGEGYYYQASAAIIFTTLNSSNVNSHVKNFHRVCEDAPYVSVHSKSDVTRPRSRIINYVISSQSNSNLELPFLDLARRLTGHEDLVFVHNT